MLIEINLIAVSAYFHATVKYCILYTEIIQIYPIMKYTFSPQQWAFCIENNHLLSIHPQQKTCAIEMGMHSFHVGCGVCIRSYENIYSGSKFRHVYCIDDLNKHLIPLTVHGTRDRGCHANALVQ